MTVNGYVQFWWGCVDLTTGAFRELTQIQGYYDKNYDNIATGSSSSLYCADGPPDSWGYTTVDAYQKNDPEGYIQLKKVDGYNPVSRSFDWNGAVGTIFGSLTDPYSYRSLWLSNINPSTGESAVVCDTDLDKLGWVYQRIGVSTINSNGSSWWGVAFLNNTKGTRLARFPLAGENTCTPVYTSMENLYDLYTIIWNPDDQALLALGTTSQGVIPTLFVLHGEGGSATFQTLLQWSTNYRLKNYNSASYSQGLVYTLLIATQGTAYDYLSIFDLSAGKEVTFIKTGLNGKATIGFLAGYGSGFGSGHSRKPVLPVFPDRLRQTNTSSIATPEQ